KVFGIMEVQSPPSGTRHHSRRLSVDFLHERDVSVASIDTFAEENYYTDRNVETYAGTSNMLGASKKENNESAMSSFLRQQVVSLFGGGGNNSFMSNDSAEKSGDVVGSSSTKTKYKTSQTGHSNEESVMKHHQTRRVASLDSDNIPHKNRRSLIAERGLLTDASNTIRSTSSATIQYIGSDGTTTSQSLAAAPPPPITTTTPRQL
ncbi:13442_t:CDS:1, partial [Acaulospora morrowiae]